ncbi:hypothetical protein ACF1A5_33005 [Streptomyces sp. NPDC014864]|uniref:hypothetical protein n=1 Tax=Streptomyces sp. NPDC014864 TaxID=3364924 RepID=UPI0036F72497
MLVHEAAFTIEVGESGYLIGFTEHDDYPAEMPYGWRCGPADPASAIVLTTTDTGPLHLTIQIHDTPPALETDNAREPAEEMSLLAHNPQLRLETLEPGDILDAWPQGEPPLQIPPTEGHGSVRMRLHCHADDPEPGIGDHGERHLIQLWRAPHTPPLHPEISEADRQARAEYAADRARAVDDYTTTYSYTYGEEQG